MIKDKILVIDDEAGIRSSLRGILEDEGYIVKTTDTGEKGLNLLRGENFDILLLDIWLPEMSGIEVLERLKSSKDNIQVIMITGHGTIETAVKATKLGAFDFLEKPLSLEKVIVTVKNALRQKRLEEENIQLRAKARAQLQIVGQSASVMKLKEQIKAVASNSARVLINGEEGSGKELVARLIHEASERRNKRFILVSSAAIPEDLIESQLFGCVMGTLPHGGHSQTGKLMQAGGGTIYLDEIGDMSLAAQDKLSRFIDEKEFEPLGSSETLAADVRLIAATSKDLRDLILKNKFREDLYFKLNTVSLITAPLREKKEDIPLLIKHYLEHFTAEYGQKPKRMHQNALSAFKGYSWPGNVNELINVIERFVIMVKDEEINSGHLSLLVEPRESLSQPRPAQAAALDLARENFEKDFIHKALVRHKWNVSKAASELRLSQEQLHEKIKILGISILG